MEISASVELLSYRDQVNETFPEPTDEKFSPIFHECSRPTVVRVQESIPVVRSGFCLPRGGRRPPVKLDVVRIGVRSPATLSPLSVEKRVRGGEREPRTDAEGRLLSR